MKLLVTITLIVGQLDFAFGESAPEKFDLRFPTKEHLTASRLYQMGNTAKAIEKVIGQFVLLDVIVAIERDVPLVKILIPEELASDPTSPPMPILAHLISATSLASSRKKGERLRIEGMIVDEGYDAYTIYLHNFQLIK